ncbi:tRNA dihydrouridine synthase [Desulfonauticus submarinus]|nr:tRNA-dihydrouridine synthase family protein [Desulfonauticus submarinus]
MASLLFSKFKQKPFLILSPMVGLTHLALRKIIREFGGCALLSMEMCSAKALPYENRATSPYFKFFEEEKYQLICQIIGNNPKKMADAAKRIEQEGLFGIDLNFGCSVSHIYKQQAGAYLLENVSLASQIIEAVKKAVSIPVSIKFRLPTQCTEKKLILLAKMFEQSGADFLIFHPRIYPDRRNRPPRWEYISVVKQSVSIPVLGNGNVFSIEDVKKMFQQTGCDGVALGRIAAARPFIFAQITQGFQPTIQTYYYIARKMCLYLFEFYEPTRALRLFKKWLPYFGSNFDFGLELISILSKAKDKNEILSKLNKIHNLKILNRPNLILIGQ